jgi:glucose-1-phosphate cytidylyltransferase
MVEIGGKPILWHIMKNYADQGVTEFIVCLGYKGFQIKEYFTNYFLHTSDISIDLSKNSVEIHSTSTEDWKVTLVDTGDLTQTGGRLKRIERYLPEGDFYMTYGDGLSNVNLGELKKSHLASGAMATVTVVQPKGRFGVIDFEEGRIRGFQEKPRDNSAHVSAGYFMIAKACLNLIVNDQSSWEETTLPHLASSNQLNAYFHSGFWQPMDTLRDKNLLESLWNDGEPPWKIN